MRVAIGDAEDAASIREALLAGCRSGRSVNSGAVAAAVKQWHAFRDARLPLQRDFAVSYALSGQR
jgi:hypothetical protein